MVQVHRAQECLPGDITVTPIPGGFLIGRALPGRDDGRWWEYVQTAATLNAATHVACRLAEQTGVRAWVYEGGTTYGEISKGRDASPR